MDLITGCLWLEVWLSSKERGDGNVETHSCLFGRVGWLKVFACPLVVGPSVELLCCSPSGSWDSNIPLCLVSCFGHVSVQAPCSVR
jgi:hypothetical protein